MMIEERDNIHILIVDDEESIRYTFNIFLQREGYGNVTAAATFDEAVEIIKSGPVDLVISDIVLGDKSGTDLLRQIRELGVACPVVMITGFPNLETAAESVRHGAFDYLAKPVNKETLLRFVRQALNQWQLEKERKRLQQENNRYRRYLEVIFSSVSDAIITVDEKLNIIQLNDTASRWFAELVAEERENLQDLEGDLANACLADARAVIQEGRTVREHQLEYYQPNGERRMVSLTGAPLQDDLEELAGAVLVIRDITPGAVQSDHGSGRGRFHGFIGSSPVMQGIYNLIENVGKVDTAVLVTGESGTGKEVTAEALHAESRRKLQPLIKVDCASVPEDLLESELFGHRRGAFTGAERDRPGRLLQADKGTLFLDEIGDISPRMQLRLLRFLQEQTFTPVGEDSPVQVDVRIVAATNVNLQEKVRANQFREDLYYRLKVVEIHLPPLRERHNCIPELVHHFLLHYADKLGRDVYTVSDQVMATLCSYSWPGNIRELRHVIERGCVMCTGSTLLREHLPGDLLKVRMDRRENGAGGGNDSFSNRGSSYLDTLSERERILQLIARAGGNKSEVARLMGIDRSTLYRKMKRYKIAPEEISG